MLVKKLLPRILAIAFGLAFLLGPQQSSAATCTASSLTKSCIGQSCAGSVGVTAKTTDSHHILACLLDDTTNLPVWKGMTSTTVDWSSMPSGAACGGSTSGDIDTITVTCQGHNPHNDCPAGFTRVGGDFQSPGDRRWYTCVKN